MATIDIRTALAQATEALERATVAAPRLTAEVLLAHALGRDRTWLFAHPEQELSDLERLHYGRYLHERISGRPVQYITGRQEFYGREFRVTPAVLIPRPETELVVEAALAVEPRGVIVDAGCGSGAIAITLELETRARVFATDISQAALEVASQNARRLGSPVLFVCMDLVSALAAASVDLIVSNPPYVADGEEAGLQREVRDFEPRAALFAGPTGFEVYERLIADAPRVLRPGGRLILELGFRSRDRVLAMFDGRWRNLQVRGDLAGIPRVLAAELAPAGSA